MTAALAPAVLDVAAWRERSRAHEERVDVWLTPHLARRRRGERHPMADFLFTSRETQHAHEQPGCLHANMDLRMRNSGNFRSVGVSKRHEADNRGRSQ
ncbi:hypothetical protein [Micromonospora sp. NBC_00617]|uniref:hypothetical protein n=1 Tax=Micromonospora sp. NBC_00617 TaxID=2903587 RepID=UPI0038671D5A